MFTVIYSCTYPGGPGHDDICYTDRHSVDFQTESECNTFIDAQLVLSDADPALPQYRDDYSIWPPGA